MSREKFCRSVVILFIMSLAACVDGQIPKQDTLRSKAVEVSAEPDTTNGEIVLDEMFIQGKMEKPGVMIIPKRVEPKLDEQALERSFTKELKEGVGEIMKPEKELREVDRVKSIKKAIERKRK